MKFHFKKRYNSLIVASKYLFISNLFIFLTRRLINSYEEVDLNEEAVMSEVNNVIANCLLCGDEITYGRKDRKFCCVECKNKYNYKRRMKEKAIKTRVANALSRNYKILKHVMNKGLDSVMLGDLILRGFNPNFVTSYTKFRRHDEFSCFDIKYNIIASKICNIHHSSIS